MQFTDRKIENSEYHLFWLTLSLTIGYILFKSIFSSATQKGLGNDAQKNNIF